MNISQPVSSSLYSADFSFLNAEEIRKISVKRLFNPQTFDELLHPVPGGLYDLALGAFADQDCATCRQGRDRCPGHCGHIDLPGPIYNCTFINQAFRLLRAQCLNCHRLRMRRALVHLYCCKLKLIRLGLVKEAVELDIIMTIQGRSKKRSEVTSMGSSDDDSDEEGTHNTLIQKLTSTTNEYISTFLKSCDASAFVVEQNETIIGARKRTLKALEFDLINGSKCASCNFLSPKYRKNGAISVFRKSLSKKQHDSNRNLGFGAPQNPLVKLRQQRELAERIQRRAQLKANKEIDEGVADLDSPSPGDYDEIRVFEAPNDGGDEADASSGEELDMDTADDTPGGFTDSMAGTAKKKRGSRKEQKENTPSEQEYIDSSEVYALLTLLFQNEQELMQQLYIPPRSIAQKQTVTADAFFFWTLLVPPNRFRRENKTSGEVTESPDNRLYSQIMAACDRIIDTQYEVRFQVSTTQRAPGKFDDIQTAWMRLQEACNALMDKDKSSLRGPAAKAAPNGIKQKFEKKEGLFRMNIMGKRVNFAARSVISPDPNIETNEIGVPPVFAKKLTYPEPVTDYSFEELKQAVINGPEWPGAEAIEQENGQIINLRRKSIVERQGLANTLLTPSTDASRAVQPKKVHRHLINGDIVIMNRQPTLHKPSMMAHKAKVLHGEKTLRMHYANCKTYNADFDGDEMNLHFPQNELGRAEANLIANAENQYLSATAGEPLRGLIQDHISVGVWLSSKGTLFSREEYQELVYSCLRPEDRHTSSEKIRTVPPAILRPAHRWTGKQLIDTILLNIKSDAQDHLTFDSKSSTSGKLWGASEENLGAFKVLRGEFLVGTLDKKQIGPSYGGLVHSVYEAYGGTAAGKMMSVLSKLLTRLLNLRAFSCGVDDLIITSEGETARRAALGTSKQIGFDTVANYVTLQDKVTSADDPELLIRMEEVIRDDGKLSGLDQIASNQASKLTSKSQNSCLDAMEKTFPKNQMQTMYSSGAKGSAVNATQISSNLGQQSLEGRRVPVMISGKTLPSFKPFESDLRAGGFIADRFITGVRPQEYYFHLMSGREGLVDTAVKTSRSGYLQRCLIKGMEGLKVSYDTSVRDSDGTLIQTLYGEDGIDSSRASALQDFTFIGKNFMSVYDSSKARLEVKFTKSEEARKYNKKAEKVYRKTGQLDSIDPASAVFNPSRHAGCTSESYLQASRKYTDDNPDNIIREKTDSTDPSVLEDVNSSSHGFLKRARAVPTQTVRRKQFEEVLDLKYVRALVEPGEAVGVVAGQSIGEPSTQMTLNTFHLAGVAAKNVTLGTPRLREILMTASANIKTPTMLMYFIEGLPRWQQEQFAKSLTRRPFSDVVDGVSVTETISKNGTEGLRNYTVHMKLYPPEEYNQEYSVQTNDIQIKLETNFFPILKSLVRKEIKRREGENSAITVHSDAVPQVGISSGRERTNAQDPTAENPGNADVDDEEDLDKTGDGDATDAKLRANQEDVGEYDEDEDDGEMIKVAEREASSEPEDAAEKLDQPEASNHDATGLGDFVDEASAEHAASDSNVTDSESDVSTDRKKANAACQDRIAGIMPELSHFRFDVRKGTDCIFTLSYPLDSPKILLLPLVNRALQRSVLISVDRVSSVLLQDPIKPDSKDPKEYLASAFVQGENILAMRGYLHFIQPHSLYTNSIHAVLEHYGVEAARNTIIRELGEVFSAHSIDVGTRHLMLVADYMTRDGGYRAFSRGGMTNSSDLFKKMSFETSTAFLRDGVLEGEGLLGRNAMGAPSAAISLGRLPIIGTGMGDVMVDVSPNNRRAARNLPNDQAAVEHTNSLAKAVMHERDERDCKTPARNALIEKLRRKWNMQLEANQSTRGAAARIDTDSDLN